jgi:anti-sigma factor RsiW
MNDRLIDCEELGSLLSLYMEGEADDAERMAVERHAAGCARCAALLSDMNAIVREAGELPALTPSRDLWPAIEARIQPEVVPLSAARAENEARVQRVSSRWTTARLTAAAAALVVSTAGVTYVATTRADSARTTAQTTAQTTAAAGPAAMSGVPDSQQGTRASSLPRGTVRNASALSSEQIYDQEIAHLQTIVRERRSLLDTTTIAVIQRNLAIIDSAIAQSRAALAADPNSRFLNEQLNSVLGQKVELLRTAALLPART